MKINRQELTILLLTCIFTCASTVSFARVITSESDNIILNRKCDELFIWNKNNFENEQDKARQNNNGNVELDLLQFQFMEQRANLYYFDTICPSHPNASSRLRNANESLQLIQGKCIQKGFDETCDLIVKNKPQEYIDNNILAIIAEGKKNSQNQSNNNSQTTQNTANDATTLTSQCVQITDTGNYGGIKNTCPYKIEVKACGYRPKKGTTVKQHPILSTNQRPIVSTFLSC